MSNETLSAKLVLPANKSNSTSTTPTSSSPTPLSLHSEQQQQISINGNGILNDGKLTSNNYQNGVLPDLQATFQDSSWSNVMDPLSGGTGDHPFDIHNGSRMFEPQTTLPTPLMTMQQQLSYQQVMQNLLVFYYKFFFLKDLQRRPITAAHNFPTQITRGGNGIPTIPMNGRWNNQSSSIGPPPHIQQQQPQSPTWNTPTISHGYPTTSYVFLIF